MNDQPMSYTLRVVKPKQHPAEDMGGFFIPEDVPVGEVWVCHGMCARTDRPGYKEAIIVAYRSERDFLFRVLTREDGGEWSLSTGLWGDIDGPLAAAIAHVLGKVV